MTVLLIIGGLVALLLGAELLVRAGTGMATRLLIPPMVIGLTVVSLGTSLPELAIGIDAARGGSPALAVGNIVGTNLVNLLFVLGLTSLLVPVVFERRTLRFDLPAMVVPALALFVLARDGVLARSDGILLVLWGVVYTGGVLYAGRRDPERIAGDRTHATRERSGALRLVLGLVIGLVAIVAGAELLVEGAVEGAHAIGVSEAVIGLTVIAIGTSAPELVTTLVSTIRGKRDMAIGNLLGSSVYNIAVVLGLTCVVAPAGCRFRQRSLPRISCCWCRPRWLPRRSCSPGHGSVARRAAFSSRGTSGTLAGSWPPAPRDVQAVTAERGERGETPPGNALLKRPLSVADRHEWSGNTSPQKSKGRRQMDSTEALEELSIANRSLKLFVSWLESQTDEQMTQMASGDWIALTSASHNLEERAIEMEREMNRGREVRT